MTVRCPKCGREAGDDAVICAGCDFILDSSFLGDDIMDAEADRRVRGQKASKAKPAPEKSKKRKRPRASTKRTHLEEADGSWAADALILGELDDADVSSFQASDTGLAVREVSMARMYVGGSIQALLMPDAIPEVAPDVTRDSVRMTPFERHVLELVNGKRPVARIKQKARLKDDDFQTALALLADKGFLRLKGRAKRVRKKTAREPTTTPKEERTLLAESSRKPERGNAADEHRPLSFVDSIVSEESVFAAEERAPAKKAPPPREPRATSKPPRASRRPPLPGELSPPAPISVDDDDDDAHDIHDEPTSATLLPRSDGVFAPTPPPLPPDASREELPPVAARAQEEDAVGFEELETAPPAPITVDPADISLRELSKPPLPEPPSPSTAKSATPPLPGAKPPPLPGAKPPPPLVATPMPASPPPSPAGTPDVQSEEEGSDSGESAGAPVSFELRRKASRIFEQAEKDIADGNVSSAIMNLKLALIYNPGEKRYRQFLKEWESRAGEAKASKDAKFLEEVQRAEQQGDYEKALALLQKALERAPRNAGLHNRVGVLLATRLKRYKEAAEHVLTAIDLAPGNLAYKNNLGKILAKEESAIHKMPMKKKRGSKDDDKVVVKKIRPKLF